jgi:hypothetical protein
MYARGKLIDILAVLQDQSILFNPVKDFQLSEVGVTPWEELLPRKKIIFTSNT